MDNEKIARQYFPMVYNLAKKFNYTDYDELCSIAFVGLAKAINAYNPELDNKASFTTFAYRCIFNELRRNAYKYPSTVSLNEIVGDDSELGDFFGYNYYNEMIENVENKVINKPLINHILQKVEHRFSPDIVNDFKRYYGIGCTPTNQPQIALEKGVSRATISSHICKVKKFLKGLRLHSFN